MPIGILNRLKGNNAAADKKRKEEEEAKKKKEEEEQARKDAEEDQKDASYVFVPVPTPDNASEQIGLEVTTAPTDKENDVLVRLTVRPGVGVVRTPVDIVCVVDVSGSMSDSASIKNDAGVAEGHGLSILDVVKHAVKTITHSLQPCDRIAVVAFESNARVAFPLTQATSSNKRKADAAVDALHPSGGTNLWAGLETGMELLREKNERSSRFGAVLILTDGQPDYNPEANLRVYKDAKKELPTINTFGFGYNVDTPMLLNIAQEGNGMHSFIPDASFVGTAFVNAITNLMVTVASNVTLSVEPEDGVVLAETLGNTQVFSWGARIDLGSLQYGQAKDAVLRVTLPPGRSHEEPFANVTLRYERGIHPAGLPLEEKTTPVIRADANVPEVLTEHLRLTFVNVLKHLIVLTSTDPSEANHKREELLQKALDIPTPHAKAISEDIAGQVREALEKAYFQKWGRHYLPSLARAHQLQQCNNFKDPGVQAYGGDLFRTLRDTVEDIFIKLPPPTPSNTHSYDNYGGGHSASNAAPLASMAAYYNASGGCIDSACVVTLRDGSSKRVDQIVRGDVVGKDCVVRCVVETRCRDKKESLVTLPGGLRLTPYHPVFVQNEWKFPVDLAKAERDVACEKVFNFVLEGGHSMTINGVQCVTLGHGLEGRVISHPYFGTDRVINDLKSMPGWNEGKIVLRADEAQVAVRDKTSGMVCGFVRNNAAVAVQM